MVEPAPLRFGFFLVLASLTTLGPFSLDMYIPGLPLLASELGATESMAQLTLTGCLAGLALGQLLVGPISDALGRRAPLITALASFAIASLLCSLAPSILVLVGLRVLQGMAGGAAIVVAVAVVRDLYAGKAAAKLFSLLVVITLLSPLLAPTLGGGLLLVTSWRGVFVSLAGLGLVVLVAAAFGLPETLPTERRRRGGIRDAAQTMGRLFVDRTFIGFALPSALAIAALIVYLAGSSFVLEHAYGVSPQFYGLLFGLNGLALGLSSQTNRWLLKYVSPERLFAFGLAGCATAGVGLFIVVTVGVRDLAAIIAPVVMLVASNGFVAPNALALALSPHPNSAGNGSALIGALRFGVGGALAPLVGLVDRNSAFALGSIMCLLCIGSIVAFLGLRPSSPNAAAALGSPQP